MRRIFQAIVGCSIVLGVASCGGTEEQAFLSAELGWRFDYKAWTEPDAPERMRACDNEPENNPGQPYPDIAKVRVQFTDPDGQTRNYDQEFDCSLGAGDSRAPIRGLANIVYDLQLSALDADGTVLYSHAQEGLDLSNKLVEDYTLRAETGEVRVSFNYATETQPDFSCQDDVETLRVAAYALVDDEPVAEPSTEREVAECTDGVLPQQLYVRTLPTDPVATPAGGYKVTEYEIVAEGLDAQGNVVYCGADRRRIKPGNLEDSGNLSGGISLEAGACLEDA